MTKRTSFEKLKPEDVGRFVVFRNGGITKITCHKPDNKYCFELASYHTVTSEGKVDEAKAGEHEYDVMGFLDLVDIPLAALVGELHKRLT
jgi:hypothetical protein